MASVEALGERVCEGGTSAGVVTYQTVGKLKQEFSTFLWIMAPCLLLIAVMGTIQQWNLSGGNLSSSLLFGLGVLGIAVYLPLIGYVLFQSRRHYEFVTDLLKDSEELFTIRSSHPVELSTAKMQKIGLAMMGVSFGLFAISSMQEGSTLQMAMISVFLQGGWMLLQQQSRQLEGLRVASAGLVWDQALMTMFIPWSEVKQWDIKEWKPDPVLSLKVEMGRSEKSYFQIGLPGIGSEERRRLVELMEEYCGVGVATGKVGA